MTVALHLEGAITAVAGLTVTGLTICDLNAIPEPADYSLAYMIPEQGLVTDFEITRVTWGSMNLVDMDATYTLNYRLLVKPEGSTSGLKDITPAVAAMAVDVVEAIMSASTITGLVKWKPRIADFGIYGDPTGKPWHGCHILIDCLDFAQ